MAILSAKYLYAMLISIFITAMSFVIEPSNKHRDSFAETMDQINAEQRVSLQLVKMRVDTVVARAKRKYTK